jgi:hypothetical protein
MKHSEFERFDATVGRLLAVPRDQFQRRLNEFKAQPGKRGPKRKVKPSASLDSGASQAS